MRQRILNRITPSLLRRITSQLDHCTLSLVCGWSAISVISLIICVYSLYVTKTIIVFPRDNVSSIVDTLIVFLGVTTAILIAALMTAHVQARTKQDSGFDAFLKFLGSFKVVVLEIDEILKSIAHQGFEASLGQWASTTDRLITALNEVTPLWRGYDHDAKLECLLSLYVNSSTAPVFLVIQPNTAITQKRSNDLQIEHEQSLRGLLVGLSILDEATVERRFAGSLVKIFASLSLLLLCCLLVRMAAGVGYGQVGTVSNWVNLFIYVFLPGIAIVNFVVLLYVVLTWWSRLQRRDEMWAS